MLRIEDLHVEIGGKLVLKGVNLNIKPGETHILFGPNGSGKSSLIGTIMGFKRFKVTKGKIYFKDEDITEMSIDERARLGVGIAFQRPPVLRGVSMHDLLHTFAHESKEDVKEWTDRLNLTSFLSRDVNAGFSGGEIKRSELLQLVAQSPDLILLDEPESGVDLQNIALIGDSINYLLQKNGMRELNCPRLELKRSRHKSGLIITHTGYILEYVPADVGHVLFDGRFSCSGFNPLELLKWIQEHGYSECSRCLERRV